MKGLRRRWVMYPPLSDIGHPDGDGFRHPVGPLGRRVSILGAINFITTSSTCARPA